MTMRETFDFAAAAINHALGEEIVYTRAGIAPLTVEAVFSSGFERVHSGEVRVSSARPELVVRYADFEADGFVYGMGPEDVRGDHVAVAGLEFDVVTSRPDPEGVSTTLVLKRV
jgi:hypothetical protein